MAKGMPAMAAEVEVARGVYPAIRRGSIPAAVRAFDPQIVRIEPAGFPLAGTYRGLAAVTAHLSMGRGTWAEGSCEPERFVVADDGVIVLLHVRERLKTESQRREGDLADVFTFRNGKAIEMRTFGEQREALEWAGVNDSDTD